MKALDKNKLSEQYAFITKWKQAKAIGTLEACTGYGKTTVGILAIREMNQNHPERVSHVVVPTLVLKNQWESTITEWKLQHVTVWVVNTYIKEVRYCNLLVLDEIHRYGSKTFREVFLRSRFNFILGLTATLERRDGMHSLIYHYAPVLKTITIEEAQKRGFVSDFRVYNLGVKLSDGEKQEYDEIQKRYDYYFQMFDNDFDLAMRALKDANFRMKYGNEKGVSSTEIRIWVSHFYRYLQMRKTLLNEASVKIQAVKQIYEDTGKKMIVFCETTAFADRIAEALGDDSFAYHNAIPDKKVMKQQLEDFKNGKGNHKAIVAVKAIEEGLDIPDLEMAVIASGNSTKRQYIQRMGRSLRVKPGKTAFIINIYVYGTQDENWLKNRQVNNEKHVAWVSSTTEICQEIDGRIKATPVDQHKHTSYNGSAIDF